MTPTAISPFLVSDDDACNDANKNAYRDWREKKLAGLSQGPEDLIVDIDSLATITSSEQRAIARNCRRTNMAIYRCRDTVVDTSALRSFGEHFGLRRLDHHLCAEEDGVSELTVANRTDNATNANGERKADFIPYTSRRLGWHTDGYYNDDDHRIATVLLHCAQPAASGGENALLDPDIAYIRLRDENPDFIVALIHPECMTIPGHASRPGATGPVFGTWPSTGALYMRYTARSKNITWRDDPGTRRALTFLTDLLASNDAAIRRVRLKAGEGVIFNNVLHNRAGFEDDPENKRLVYRARYLDPINWQQEQRADK